MHWWNLPCPNEFSTNKLSDEKNIEFSYACFWRINEIFKKFFQQLN